MAQIIIIKPSDYLFEIKRFVEDDSPSPCKNILGDAQLKIAILVIYELCQWVGLHRSHLIIPFIQSVYITR